MIPEPDGGKVTPLKKKGKKTIPKPNTKGAGFTPGWRPPGFKGGSNPAPSKVAVADRAAAVKATAPSAAEMIGNYNLARAEILKGLAPQVQGIYDHAQQNVAGFTGGLTQDMQQRLTDAGRSAIGGADPNDPTSQRIMAGYNPQTSAAAAYALGATFPGESLNKQGAAFGAAAAFAPERALQEGQYAVQAAVREAAEAAAKAGASNAKLQGIDTAASKLTGYLTDKLGRPITGKNGKPIPIAAPSLTPYQQASLGMQGARLDASTAATQARLNQSADQFNRNLTFKTAKAEADYQLAYEKGKRPNAALSAKYGYLVDSNGHAIKNAKGRHIPVAKEKSVTDTARIDKMVKEWYEGKHVKAGTVSGLNEKGNKKTEYINKQVGQIGYQVALRKLRNQYKYNLREATDLLNQHWKRGERGRPLISFEEAKIMGNPKFKKIGITPNMLRQARSGTSVDARNAYRTIQAVLVAHGISL